MPYVFFFFYFEKKLFYVDWHLTYSELKKLALSEKLLFLGPAVMLLTLVLE